MAEPAGTGEGNFFQRLFRIKPKTEAITPTSTPQPEKVVLSPFAQQIAVRNAQAKVGAQVDVVAPPVFSEKAGIDAAAANQAQIKQNFGNGAPQDGGAFGSGDPTGKIIDAPKNTTLPGDA
jgi:hypothetical protein